MNKMFSDELLKFKLPALLSPGKPSVWQADKSAACKKHQNYNSLGAAAEFIKTLKPDFSMKFEMAYCFCGFKKKVLDALNDHNNRTPCPVTGRWSSESLDGDFEFTVGWWCFVVFIG